MAMPLRTQEEPPSLSLLVDASFQEFTTVREDTDLPYDVWENRRLLERGVTLSSQPNQSVHEANSAGELWSDPLFLEMLSGLR